MLYSLVLLMCTQLPMDKIIVEQPKEVRIYVMVDKFNKIHENENRSILLLEVSQANKQTFKLQDKSGKWWEDANLEFLKQWIENENRKI